MHIGEGVHSNMHMHEVVGLNFNSLRTDALLKELEAISSDEHQPKNKENERAKQVLIFMATTWKKNTKK